jgi:hypothetical protein
MAHYAISEFLIVLAALWGANRLVAQTRATAAFGLLLFGAAAAIGAVRFPFDLIEPWADMHRFAGMMGGLLAMMALVHQIVRFETARLSPSAHIGLAALGLGVALAMPGLRVLLFLLWSLGFIWLAARHTPNREASAWIKAGVAGFMLFNVIVFRQSPYLDPAVSWHIFHVLVAAWMVGVSWLLTMSATAKAKG